MVCAKDYITLHYSAFRFRLAELASGFRPVARRMYVGCVHGESIKNVVLMDSPWTHYGHTMDSPQRKGVSSYYNCTAFVGHFSYWIDKI